MSPTQIGPELRFYLEHGEDCDAIWELDELEGVSDEQWASFERFSTNAHTNAHRVVREIRDALEPAFKAAKVKWEPTRLHSDHWYAKAALKRRNALIGYIGVSLEYLAPTPTVAVYFWFAQNARVRAESALRYIAGAKLGKELGWTDGPFTLVLATLSPGAEPLDPQTEIARIHDGALEAAQRLAAALPHLEALE